MSRKHSRRQESSPLDVDRNEELDRETVPLVVFALLLAFSIICLVADSLTLTEDRLKLNKWLVALHTVVEHGASALIVASVMGLSYEWLLHKRRARFFMNLLGKYKENTFDALKTFMLLEPKEIFGLLRDIAVQTRKVPTLYEPPRERDGEFVFTSSIEYFDMIVDSARKDVKNVLAGWVSQESHRNLKFLGSDFVGRYKLHELAKGLMSQAGRKLTPDQWSCVKPEDQGWILNYYWAASRCESPMYESLSHLLLNTDDELIQRWILFVPQQMPDPELCVMLETYLRDRQGEISTENKKLVIRALAQLCRGRVSDARRALLEFRSLFMEPDLLQEIRRAWSGLKLPDELREAIRSLPRAIPAAPETLQPQAPLGKTAPSHPADVN
jgi:hypothetical protein